MDVRERLTVAFYCTTALPIIVAVTTVAVSAEAMSQETASVLVAAGGVTVFLMPLLASLATHTMNADLGRAVRSIRQHPGDAGKVLKEHWQLERQRHAQLKKLPHTWSSYDIDSRCPGGHCERQTPPTAAPSQPSDGHGSV